MIRRLHTTNSSPTSQSSWLELSMPESEITQAGVDEVGRGALFGPVVAAAVVLPNSALPQLVTAGINDSKKLSVHRRRQLFALICAQSDWKIGYATTAEIDRLNILQASLLAMKRAVLKLSVQPDICLIDGNQSVKGLLMPQKTIIKGDSTSIAIAAASIIAKVWRDDLILRLATKYPMYDLVQNKGYGSRRHLLALQQYGASRLHRKSFSPCQVQVQLELELDFE